MLQTSIRKSKEEMKSGRELYADGGTDAMENMFYSIEFRIKDEIKKDAKPYRLWWNNISEQTQFTLFRDYKTKL
jgi:hypothetical protein